MSNESAQMVKTVAGQRFTLERWIQGGLLVLAALALARGTYLIFFTLPSSQWRPLAFWLVAGIIANDLLIAPASVLLGRIFLRRRSQNDPHRRSALFTNAVRGAWLGVGTVLLIGITLLVGAGQRANPTVVPGDPVRNILLSVGLMVIGAALVATTGRLLQRIRRRRLS